MVRFTAGHGLPAAVRGGGHSFAGQSSTTGVLIDLTPMNRVEVLSGPFDGLHGWELLNNPGTGAFTPVAAKVAAFITAHTSR